MHRAAGTATVLLLIASQIERGDPNRGQVTTVHATLLSPLTSTFSQKGDVVSARITDPDDLRGAMLEGEVQAVQKNNSNKRTVLQITLQSLHQNEKVTAVSVNVLGIASSKSEKGHDDGGAIVEFGGGTRKGHWMGGGKDREGGATEGSSPSIRLSAESSNLSLAVGTSLDLELVRH